MENFLGEFRKPNSMEYAVGLDLTDAYAQLSYGLIESEEIETFSLVAGSTDFLIPAALFKKRDGNQWYAGKDALSQNPEDGYLVDKLVTMAMNEDEVLVGDEKMSPASLIALFVKRILGQANVMVPTNKIGSFMVTVKSLTPKMVAVMSEALGMLGLKTENIFFQSHMESFYYYTIYSPRELWQHSVMLFDFTEDYLSSLNMVCNKNTTPIVVFIDPKLHSLDIRNVKEMEPGSFQGRAADRAFLEVINKLTSTRVYSSFYLIGDHFSQGVFDESIKVLCRKGHVYSGNNLFSKGAVCGARNKVSATILSNNHVFLGNDKLKSNVGMNVLKRGENAYMPLLDAGINWYEATRTTDIILNSSNKISLVITPLTGKNPEIVDITLNELPKRPDKTTRLRISVKMIEETKMQVHIKDLGFGNLYPATDLEWYEEVSL